MASTLKVDAAITVHDVSRSDRVSEEEGEGGKNGFGLEEEAKSRRDED